MLSAAMHAVPPSRKLKTAEDAGQGSILLTLRLGRGRAALVTVSGHQFDGILAVKILMLAARAANQ